MSENNGTQKDPMEMLSALSKNPEALRSIMSAFSASQNAPAGMGQTPMPDISKILADPESLSKISSIMTALSAQTLPQNSHQGASDTKSAALLTALKPYLSADRQAAIESLIKFSKLGEIFKNL